MLFFNKFIYRYPIVSFARDGFYILDNNDNPFFYRCAISKILKPSKSYRLEFDKNSSIVFLCLKDIIYFSKPWLYQ